MVGQTLTLRNSEWINGTIPGFCIAFAGSNTDVTPNDRLPIMPETHEDDICKSKCVKASRLTKMSRQAQRTQATTNGYFGGYIGKRQKAGQMETKKCIDKMYTLRQRNQNKDENRNSEL